MSSAKAIAAGAVAGIVTTAAIASAAAGAIAGGAAAANVAAVATVAGFTGITVVGAGLLALKRRGQFTAVVDLVGGKTPAAMLTSLIAAALSISGIVAVVGLTNGIGAAGATGAAGTAGLAAATIKAASQMTGNISIVADKGAVIAR